MASLSRITTRTASFFRPRVHLSLPRYRRSRGRGTAKHVISPYSRFRISTRGERNREKYFEPVF